MLSKIRKLTSQLTNPTTRELRNERQTLKDRDLARRCYDTFEKELAAADIRGLHFYAKDGVVTVYGVIRYELDRDLIVSLIRQVPGVKDIVMNVQVTE